MQLVAYPDKGEVFVESRSETGRNYAGFFILEIR
jgi:hypothetical protein